MLLSMADARARCGLLCDTVMIASACDVWNESRQATLIAQILSGELSLEAACRAHGLSPATVQSWAPVFRHRTLQALDEKLHQASLITSVNAERLGSAAYTGSLDDISVADLLQTCNMGARNAIITVTRGSERSAIWCEQGVVVDAESGRLRGEPAVYRILNLHQGQVSADFRLEPRQRTIELPCHVLLIEGARHKDECARLTRQLQGQRSIVVQTPGAWTAHTTLADREVLSLCDGERDVSDVLAASTYSDLDTLTTMVNLVGRGYLLMDGASTSAPPVVAGPAADDWSHRSSIYLPLPQPASAVARPSGSAPLLVALGLVLGTIIWAGVQILLGGAPFRTAPPPATSSIAEVSSVPAYAEL
jgi:transposase-like protein